MHLTTADFLSFSRILLAHPLYTATLQEQREWVWVYLAWMALSDFLDGWSARNYGSTPWGAWIDPVCDAYAMVFWVSALWQLGCLPTAWLYFWAARYTFFAILATQRRIQAQTYMRSSLSNKISIVFWAVFSIHAWHYGHSSALLGYMLALSQLASMYLALHARPSALPDANEAGETD